jgi:hypothetical protein
MMRLSVKHTIPNREPIRSMKGTVFIEGFRCFCPVSYLMGFPKLVYMKLVNSNELKLFNGDSIILCLIYVAVIIVPERRGEAYGVYRESDCWRRDNIKTNVL